MIKVTVTSVCARSAGEEIDVTFSVSDGEENREISKFTLSSRQFLTIGISKGESDTDTFDAVRRAARVWCATKKGMMLLGYGAASKKAMRMKLVSKGFDKDVALEAADALEALGLLREGDDAAELARRLAAKLWGRKRIVSELYGKGYSSEAVEKAMDELDDADVDFVRNCRALIDKRYGGVPQEPDARKKLYAALCRYGYSSSEIKEAFSR